MLLSKKYVRYTAEGVPTFRHRNTKEEALTPKEVRMYGRRKGKALVWIVPLYLTEDGGERSGLYPVACTGDTVEMTAEDMKEEGCIGGVCFWDKESAMSAISAVIAAWGD